MEEAPHAAKMIHAHRDFAISEFANSQTDENFAAFLHILGSLQIFAEVSALLSEKPCDILTCHAVTYLLGAGLMPHDITQM